MKHISRRDFLKGSLAATACCAAAHGPFGSRPVYAQSLGGNGRTAVFINQFGGNDALNSFAIPYTASSYYTRRPNIAIPQGQVLPLGNGIGLNPALTALKTIYDNGDLAVIQSTGDPIGTRSHFTSQEYFSKGVTDLSAIDQRGWIGRLGDLYLSGTPFNTIGIGVGQQSDFNAYRPTNQPLVTSSLGAYGVTADNNTTTNDNAYRRAIVQGNLDRTKTRTDREQSAREGVQGLFKSEATLRTVVNAYNPTYPATGLGNYLKDAARLIRYGLGTVVTYGGIGGWDTHQSQRASQDPNLTVINNAISAFYQDLVTMGKLNDVVLCIFSEFGRETFENNSGGTDHGWGGAMVVIGGPVRGGVFGPTPTVNDIQNRNWIFQDIDFRNVFAEIITWLGFNPDPVFPESYEKLALNLF